MHFALGGIQRFSDDLRDFLGGAVFPLLWQNTARSQEPHKGRPPLAPECSFLGIPGKFFDRLIAGCRSLHNTYGIRADESVALDPFGITGFGL